MTVFASLQMRSTTGLGIATLILGLAGWCALASVAEAADASTTAQQVVQIDPRTGKVVRVVPNGVTPGLVAAGSGHVWAAGIGGSRLRLIDPRTGAVTVIGHRFDPPPVALAAAGDVVYVLDGDNLNTVKPGAPAAVGTFPLDAIEGSSMQLVSGGAGVWGAKGDTVFRVDTSTSPASVHPSDTVPIPVIENELHNAGLSGMAVGTDAVWVIHDDADRRLWRISATNPHITATVALPFAPAGIAVGFGRVWITDQLGNRVWELDPGTGRIDGSIAVDRDPVGVAVGGGAVWVTSAIDGTVTRIDPRSSRVSGQFATPGTTTQIAFGAGSVWATSGHRARAASGRAIRIGMVVDCYGGFAFSRDLIMAGAELPLIQRGARLAGDHPSDGIVGASVASRPVRLLTACEAWADKSTTITGLSDLVERQHADVVVAPGFSGDSIAVHDYAQHHPRVTFFLTGFEQSATLKHPLRNVFRFEPDSVMWSAGLGSYAYNTLGWRDAATVSNADGSSLSLVAGFDAEFGPQDVRPCACGEHVDV